MTARAVCWVVTRSDGVLLRGTSLNRDLVVTASGYAGTYKAAVGADVATFKVAADMSVNNTEVQGTLFTLGVNAIDIEAGLFDEAAVRIFFVDWSAPSAALSVRAGTLGQWQRDSQGRYSVEFRSLTQQLQQPISAVLSRTCKSDLGSSNPYRYCGVDLTGYAVTGSVTSVTTADRQFTDSALPQAPDWFTRGKLTWTGGSNNGFTVGIALHAAGGALTLVEPQPYDIAPGDTYTMTPGCNKQYAKTDAQRAVTSAGTVQIISGVVTVSDISGTTTTSGSVTVSGSNATFAGDGSLDIANASGTAHVVLSGTALTVTDTNGTVHNIDTTVTTTVDGDCKVKFNNLVNFNGEPWITGDATLARSQA